MADCPDCAMKDEQIRDLDLQVRTLRAEAKDLHAEIADSERRVRKARVLATYQGRQLPPNEETAQWLGEAIGGDVETYDVDGNMITFTRNGRTYELVFEGVPG